MAPIKVSGRPMRFRFEDGGELYCIGSEVGNFFKTFRGHLYKKYPNLTRRTLTTDERKKLTEHGLGKYANVSQVTLLRAIEVDEIIDGHDEPYRCGKTTTKSESSIYLPDTPTTSVGSSLKPGNIIGSISKDLAKSSRTSFSTPAVQNHSHHSSTHAYSIHLDPVPEATKINRSKFARKGRIFPLCIDDVPDPKILHTNAAQPEVLVPIRIDLDLEGQKVRDTFTWNKNESVLKPEEFAECLCYDLGVNPLVFAVPIATQIKQQIEAFPDSSIPPVNPRLGLKLNIQIGSLSLIDQIEWDMSEEGNCPEDFAKKLCTELGLGGEFITAIAYSIRGQISWHQKTSGLMGEPDIANAFRHPTKLDQWSPSLETLTEAELEKKIRDQDRHTRRLRRVAM